MQEMVRTGRAAEILGVSPRTVARMIDRGQLESYRIGGQRRVPMSALPRPSRLLRGHVPSFSHLLGVLLASELVQDPDRAFEIARRNIRRQHDRPTQSTVWTDRWERLVEEGEIARMVEILTDPDDRSGLRQTHPFRGLVSDEQRRSALEHSRRSIVTNAAPLPSRRVLPE
jgi:excisionase family DNA binding protein